MMKVEMRRVKSWEKQKQSNRKGVLTKRTPQRTDSNSLQSKTLLVNLKKSKLPTRK